jgi:hypothetical protein
MSHDVKGSILNVFEVGHRLAVDLSLCSDRQIKVYAHKQYCSIITEAMFNTTTMSRAAGTGSSFM